MRTVGRSVSQWAVAVLFLTAVTASGQTVNVTGTWDGRYTYIDRCSNGSTFTGGGAASASFRQSGTAFTGAIVLRDVIDTDGTTCVPRGGTFTLTLPISGTINGNTFSGALVSPDGPSVAVTGSVSATSMSLSFDSQHVTSGTITLSLTSSEAPDSSLTGVYVGTYTSVMRPCQILPLLTYSGQITLAIEHFGTILTVSITVTNTKRDRSDGMGGCTVVDTGTGTGNFTGQVSGNRITFFHDRGETSSATVNGTTITGGPDTNQAGESFTFSVTRTSTTVPPATVITSFTANPTSINAGQAATLSWNTSNATSVSIDNGVGPQPVSGSVTVTPSATTTYTLSATGNGAARATATVTVTGGGTARVVLSSAPRGMVQLANQGGGGDSFSLTNIGAASTTLTLQRNGDFFTIPGSVTLAAGATEMVAITGLPQPAGVVPGSVTILGNGAAGLTVPVRLLSADAPAGTVRPQPTQSRAEVSSLAGQSASGSVSFTNSGNATLLAMAVADVPWIVPQGGVITIGAGQTVQVSYTVDSSKRPDSSSPLGAVSGALSLVFLAGSSGINAAANGPVTSQVSITIAYVVKPGTSTSSPAALAPNEVAFFVPGLANRPNALGDVHLSNRLLSGTLDDLKLFLTAPGAASQLASIPRFAAGASAIFPGLIKNVFATSTQIGTAQFRAADISKVSVAGIQSNTSSPGGTFSTALPVLRSDRGVGNGGQVVLSGMSSAPGIQTHIYVQELSGNPTTVQIDSIAANGSVIASRPSQPVAAFGLLEVLDATSASTQAARVTNLGGGRIGAYALVTTNANGEAYLVTDPSVDSPSDGALIVPLISAGAGAETYLYSTNRTATPILISVDTRNAGRRRAAGGTGGSQGLAPVTEAVAQRSLSPMESVITKVVSNAAGYIRVTMPAGSLSAVGRTSRFDPGQPAYGSGLPAIPVSAALRAGDSKRFAGIDDGSPASRAARRPATFRSNLMLIETANAAAAVRVTVRYWFAAGSAVSTSVAASRDYSLAPSQFLLINDVIGEVIGSQRSAFGDLRNVDIDVEVVSGSGVIPVLHSIDNGSNDAIVRIH